MVEANVTPMASEGLIAEASKAARAGGLPPVHLWNPPFCGDIDMRIDRSGTWFHEGTPIGRFALARLFSTILKLEDGRYYLVTPVEKVGIQVDDVPFIAVDAQATGSGSGRHIIFETNMGDKVELGPDHALRLELGRENGEPMPYLHVRAGLEARIDRKTFYRLVELGEMAPHHGEDWFGIWAGGEFWPLMRAKDLQV